MIRDHFDGVINAATSDITNAMSASVNHISRGSRSAHADSAAGHGSGRRSFSTSEASTSMQTFHSQSTQKPEARSIS
jgi:hypothetical protein